MLLITPSTLVLAYRHRLEFSGCHPCTIARFRDAPHVQPIACQPSSLALAKILSILGKMLICKFESKSTSRKPHSCVDVSRTG